MLFFSLVIVHAADKPLRFVLTDVYGEGRGVIARGRVVQGYMRVDERLVVFPVGDTATVSKLEHLQPPTFTESSTTAQEQERLSIALAGDTVEIVLTGIDVMRISVGNLLASPGAPPPFAKQARAKILVMDDLTIPIIRGAQLLFHMQSLDVPAVLNKLIALTKRDGSIKRDRPRALTGGASATVEFTLSDRICMEPFSECRALGRFVLRRNGDTVAVGIIEELIL
jgi:elongation factor 1 alpha-like protein